MATEVVLDSSCLIAVLRNERGADAIVGRLNVLHMAMPNIVEVCDAICRSGGQADDVRRLLTALSVTSVPLTVELAVTAGDLFLQTRPAGLSLADRCCLALAKSMDAVAATGDRAWLRVADEIGVRVELFR